MTEPVDNIGELRSKLVRRLAIASTLVVFLMGALAVFDYLSTPEELEAPVFTEPVPVPPRKEISQPVTPAENLPEPPPPPAPVVPEAAKQAEPVPPPPAPEAAPAAPVPSGAARQRPAGPSLPAGKAAEPSRPAGKSAPGVPEASELPSTRPAEPPATERAPRPPSHEVLTPKAQREPAIVPAPAISRLFSGFVLQAGVFSSAQRAEELHARLTLSGIPSALETRVQIGPFRTRQEAEAAQEKLKSLGVETVLVPPKGALPRR